MAGSKNDALETYVLNLLAGKSSTLPTAWRIRHLITAPTPESGSGNVYSSAPAISISSGELTVSGNSLVVNATKDTATGTTTGETILRRVLEFSADGFSTILGAYYSSDVLDADDTTVTGVAVPTGTILRVPANTGFSATED
jgi:hypothetical protein